jgi:hypothetical protein
VAAEYTPTPTSHPHEPFSKDSALCLSGQVLRRSEHPLAGGGYADVCTGMLRNKIVAIKVMRRFTGSSMGIPIEKTKFLKVGLRQ